MLYGEIILFDLLCECLLQLGWFDLQFNHIFHRSTINNQRKRFRSLFLDEDLSNGDIGEQRHKGILDVFFHMIDEYLCSASWRYSFAWDCYQTPLSSRNSNRTVLANQCGAWAYSPQRNQCRRCWSCNYGERYPPIRPLWCCPTYQCSPSSCAHSYTGTCRGFSPWSRKGSSVCLSRRESKYNYKTHLLS